MTHFQFFDEVEAELTDYHRTHQTGSCQGDSDGKDEDEAGCHRVEL
jgi:hypothetical protein